MTLDRFVTPPQLEGALERLSRNRFFIQRLQDFLTELLERFQNDPEFRSRIYLRFLDGESRIGPLDLFNGIDWDIEADEEGLDLINYLIFVWMREERMRLIESAG